MHADHVAYWKVRFCFSKDKPRDLSFTPLVTQTYDITIQHAGNMIPIVIKGRFWQCVVWCISYPLNLGVTLRAFLLSALFRFQLFQAQFMHLSRTQVRECSPC